MHQSYRDRFAHMEGKVKSYRAASRYVKAKPTQKQNRVLDSRSIIPDTERPGYEITCER